MKFLPKDLSEKALAIGCVSISHFYWEEFSSIKERLSYAPIITGQSRFVSAFCFEDFAGASEQARVNARKVWPEQYNMGVPCPDGLLGCGVFHCKTVFVANEKRHHMIEAEDWIEFIRPHIEKAYEEIKKGENNGQNNN